ncbi:MAG TPA: flagellar hook capping FlgD N-terminal domain-containing protein [Acetobacteraceae bacterium]|jgi:flagellar basal-body rod modification protein FlgD|nr:flagellar hook capping FlgD N-terminal domain-containing protein [Acetobacteraceae bacterium]
MSIASVVAQQNAAAAQASAAAAAQTGSAATSSLDGNFNDFLNMLMTQLQNQDPSSPMDTDTFTSELVQFSSVEQQIQTNTSLTNLIQLTQGSEVIQGSSMIGQQVTVQSTQIPLQNGTGTVNVTSPAAEKVSISITNSSGTDIFDTTVNAAAGNNTFTWNGTNNAGQTVPNGLYTMVATGSNVGGGTSTLPFTVTGTATGVISSGTTVDLQLGPLSVPFSSITSVGS